MYIQCIREDVKSIALSGHFLTNFHDQLICVNPHAGNETLLCYDATWRKLIQHFRDERCLIRDGRGFPRRVQARGRGAHRAPPQQ